MGDSHTSSKFLVQYRDNITSRAGKFSLKTNDFYEIYTYIHGDGPYFYFANDSIYTIEPGAVLLLRPGVLVGSCKKIQARYTRLVCKIPIYMMDFICKINPVCSELFCNSDVSILNLTGERKKDYFEYVNKLSELSLHGGRHQDTLMFSILLQMLVLLCRSYNESETLTPQKQSNELIVQIINKINLEYSNISSVADLAEKMNYSKNYISQYFKTHMNMGLHDFLVMKKLSVAATKLISGRSVTDVAYECGFGSTAYFISVFKAKYGTTPGKYMSENR